MAAPQAAARPGRAAPPRPRPGPPEKPPPPFDVGLLLSLVSGLGSVKQLADGSAAYVADEQCLDCLYDIQRFLRRDEPATRDVVCQLSDWNALRQHFVPLLVTYASKFDVAFNATKVCVFMTQPCDPDTKNPGDQLRALQRAKATLLESSSVLTAVTNLLAEPLSRFAERGRMTEEDWKVAQLVLTLFRNLLAIPDPAPTAASGNDHLTRGRDVLLERLFQEDVMDLLLAVTQDANRLPFRNEAALLLEMFHELFRGASPEALFAAADRHAAAQAAALASGAGGAARVTALRKDHEASAALRAALVSERAATAAAVRAAGGAPRHSRFGGTYVRNFAAGGGSALVRNTPVAPPASTRAVAATAGAFGRSKPRLVGPQRCVAVDRSVELHAGAGTGAGHDSGPVGGLWFGGHQPGASGSSTQILAKLKTLAESFLSGPYNALMAVVLSDISVGRAPGLSDHEIHLRTLHFLRVAAFCTAFVRVSNARKVETEAANATQVEGEDVPSPWASIAETMEGRAFHWVRTEWLRLCDAKPSDADAPAIAAAGALLHQMLAVLLAALTAKEGPTASADRRVATALALRVLTDDTADEGVLANLHKMVRTFDPRRFSRTHMATLALAVDTVLRLLQALSDQADGHLHVTRRRHGGGGNGRKTKKQLAAEEAAMTDEERAAAAAERERLAADAAEKKARRQERIDAGEVVSDEEEDIVEELREAGIAMGDDDDDGGYGSGSDGGATGAQLREVKLDLPKRTARLYDPQTVCNTVWLLTNWRRNERHVNDVVVHLLERMEALSLTPMLYQLSILIVFHDIIGDPLVRQPGFQALHAFVRRTVRGMFERMLPPQGPSTPDGGATLLAGEGEDEEGLAGAAQEAQQTAPLTGPELAGKMLFVDLLFWKPRGTAVNIELDCGRFDGAGGAHLRSVAANRADIAAAIARDTGGGNVTTPDGMQAAVQRKKRRGGLLNEQQVDLLQSLFEAHKDEPKKKVFADTLCQAMADGGCPLKRSQLYSQLRSLGLVRPDMVRKPREGPDQARNRAQGREAMRHAMDFDDDDDLDDEEESEDDDAGDKDGGAAAGTQEVDAAAVARAMLGATGLGRDLAAPLRSRASGALKALNAAGVLAPALSWLRAQLESAVEAADVDAPETMPVDAEGQVVGYTVSSVPDDDQVNALLTGPNAQLLAPLMHALALRRPAAGAEVWQWVVPTNMDAARAALDALDAAHSDVQRDLDRAREEAEKAAAHYAARRDAENAPAANNAGRALPPGVVVRRGQPGGAKAAPRRRGPSTGGGKTQRRRQRLVLSDDESVEFEAATDSGADAGGEEAEAEDSGASSDEDEPRAVRPLLTARGARATAPVDDAQEAAGLEDTYYGRLPGGSQALLMSQRQTARSTKEVIDTVFSSDSDDDEELDLEMEGAAPPPPPPATLPVDRDVSARADGDEDEDMADAAPAQHQRKRLLKRAGGGAASKHQAVAFDDDDGAEASPRVARAMQASRRAVIMDDSD